MSNRRYPKQRWDPDAQFVFARSTLFDSRRLERGDPVPDSVRGHRLRRWWEAGFISRADYNGNVALGRSQDWPGQQRVARRSRKSKVREPQPVESAEDG